MFLSLLCIYVLHVYVHTYVPLHLPMCTYVGHRSKYGYLPLITVYQGILVCSKHLYIYLCVYIYARTCAHVSTYGDLSSTSVYFL